MLVSGSTSVKGSGLMNDLVMTARAADQIWQKSGDAGHETEGIESGESGEPGDIGREIEEFGGFQG
jgi:hypothetical protein